MYKYAYFQESFGFVYPGIYLLHQLNIQLRVNKGYLVSIWFILLTGEAAAVRLKEMSLEAGCNTYHFQSYAISYSYIYSIYTTQREAQGSLK